MAALELDGRKLLLSTEDVRYGGSRIVAAISSPGEQMLFRYELLIFDGSGGRP